MIVETARRISGPEYKAPTVICNDEHRFLVAESLHDAGITPQKIILEPEGRNTAAAIAIGALSVIEENPDALMLVTPSDHIISDLSEFQSAIQAAIPAAENGYIVTFGIKPTRPEPGYGYIEQGDVTEYGDSVLKIKRFVEKPDAESAKRYLESGKFNWNAGIFLFRISTVIEAFRKFDPELLEKAELSLARATLDLDFTRLDADAFETIPAHPFDIAVMEKTEHGAVIPVDMGWNDIGSWYALWDVAEKDSNGNVSMGDSVMLDTSGSMAWSDDGTLTTLVGVKDILVIANDEAVLVLDKSQADKVKNLVELFKQQGREVHLNSNTIYRPWGHYSVLDVGDGFLVKRILVKPGEQLSLQYHNHRAEHWVVVKGAATVTRGDEVFELKQNESTYMSKGMTHRVKNAGTETLVLIEVQTGDTISEEDIVRLDDSYGRHNTSCN